MEANMKIRFFSRQELCNNVLNATDLTGISVISISDSNTHKRAMRNILKGRVDHFRCYVFYDVDNSQSAFTKDKADSIIEFVNNCHRVGVQEIWVHCLMGISRSGAVAKWVNDYLGLGDLFVSEWEHYNRYVYGELCEQSGVQTLKQYYKGIENENNHTKSS
ncbi:hypothetical protein M316_0060 [Nitrincola phage 1M3-16]|uniref:hypothetical protein n=1 Tax=Nitrincola phage 1M3-16 TaxID=1472912 RepID=UPI000444DB44|nr:hypothetical protein GJ22_gp092 [Nitrincola phage 1M3-16]AHX01125.1 hypothetical protein M316_0060 [Nitrincola phage 1M3-16]